MYFRLPREIGLELGGLSVVLLVHVSISESELILNIEI